MYKKCKVVMLPTNQKAPIEKQIGSSRIDLFIGFANDKNDYIPNHERSFKQFQHLYILSDDEIKENDWCINRNLDTIYQIKAIVGNLENWIKIIATTDSSLKLYESETLAKASGFSLNTNDILLPSIPQSFIDKYISEFNKGNKIEEVMVEYLLEEYEHEGKRYHHTDGRICPKLNHNNIINIKTVRDSWSREEVIVLHKLNCERLTNSYTSDDIEWIENNL